MSKTTKAPRNFEWRTCDFCGSRYTFFRPKSKFCSVTCRVESYRSKQPLTFRAKALRKYGSFCMECGAGPIKVYVHTPKEHPDDLEHAITLCGRHHSLATSSEASEKRRVDYLVKLERRTGVNLAQMEEMLSGNVG